MGFVPDSNGSVKKSGCFNDFVGSIKRHKPMQKEKHKNELTVTVNKLFKRFDLLITKFARLRLFQNGVKLRSEEHSLNSSHVSISYAVFCLKKKTNST